MFLERRDSYKTRFLVSMATSIILFLIRFYQRPIQSDISLLMRLLLLATIVLIFLVVAVLLGVNHKQGILLPLIIASTMLVIYSPEGFPLWVDNEEIITLWRRDNQFSQLIHVDEFNKVTTLETQEVLFNELQSYVVDPLEKQHEILSLCNKGLVFSRIESGAKRYMILPKESRYAYPDKVELYWLSSKGLRLLKNNPSLLFKYLRVPIDKDTQHFQVFEIRVKEGATLIIFEGEIEHGDTNWKQSDYADLLDYQHEMPVSIVIDKAQWTEPKVVGEFYVGL